MLKPFSVALCLVLTSPVVMAGGASKALSNYLCTPDQVATVADSRTNFREKGRLKQLVLVVRRDGTIHARSRKAGAEEVFFASAVNNYGLISSHPGNERTFRMNPETNKFMATSPSDFLKGTRENDPWLIAGSCEEMSNNN